MRGAMFGALRIDWIWSRPGKGAGKSIECAASRCVKYEFSYEFVMMTWQNGRQERRKQGPAGCKCCTHPLSHKLHPLFGFLSVGRGQWVVTWQNKDKRRGIEEKNETRYEKSRLFLFFLCFNLANWLCIGKEGQVCGRMSRRGESVKRCGTMAQRVGGWFRNSRKSTSGGEEGPPGLLQRRACFILSCTKLETKRTPGPLA